MWDRWLLLSAVLKPDFNGVILDVVDVADNERAVFSVNLAVLDKELSHKYQSLINWYLTGCAQSTPRIEDGVGNKTSSTKNSGEFW